MILGNKRSNDDRAMKIARGIVERHIKSFGIIPHPDKMKESIADAIETAERNLNTEQGP